MPKVKKRTDLVRRRERERKRLERAKRTPAQVMMDRILDSQKTRERRANASAEYRAKETLRASELTRRRRQNLSKEERARWLQKHAQYQREWRAKQSPATLARIRWLNAERARKRRASLSEAQLAKIRKINAEQTRARRAKKLVKSPVCNEQKAITDITKEFFDNIGLMMHSEFHKVASDRVQDEAAQLMPRVKVEIVDGINALKL